MWSIYKGLELQIGLNDTTAITNLLTDCGASRGGQDAGDSCNWWEDYSEWLVLNQNADGSWTGYSSWPSVLSTPWFINILAATEIPNGGGPFQKTLTSGPDADSDGEIDLVVEVGQTQTTAYDFTLSYNNPDGPPVLIRDTAPAEWQVTFVNGNEVVNSFLGPISDDSGGTGTVVVFPANKKPNNKSSTKIDWTPDPSVGGSIVVDMETRGPKKNGKFAPTSCGPLYLNSGPATVTDIATSEVLFEAGPLCLAAVEDLNGGGLVLDGSGDEDGDGLSDLDEACVFGSDPCVFTNDVIIDLDGVASPFVGNSQEVASGDPLTNWPTGFDPDDHGIDGFDNDADGLWTFGPNGDDIHIEGASAACPTGIRNTAHVVGSDCVVLDLDGSLFDGQPVSCDFESGSFCPPTYLSGPAGDITFFDANADGYWDDGEDIILDVNQNGTFD